MRPLSPTALRCLVVAALYVLCVACGGGGGGGGGVVPTKCIDFVPATAQQLSMSKGTGSTCDTLVIDVNIMNPSDLFAVSFTVNYPTAVTDWQSRSDVGSILSSDGAALLTEQDDQPGSYAVAITRSGTSSGITASGTQKVTSLVFRRVGTTDTTAAISFTNPKIFNSDTPPAEQTLSGSSGGTLTID